MIYTLRGTVTEKHDPMYRDDPFQTNDIIKRVLTQDQLVETLVRWNNLGRQLTSLQIDANSPFTANPTGLHQVPQF